MTVARDTQVEDERFSPAIRDFPRGERPRERLQHYGPGSLSNAELMAILLRTGNRGENVVNMASRLLARFDGLGNVARASFQDFCNEHGVSQAKACQLIAAFELGRRASSLMPDDRPVISAPRDVASLLTAEMALLEREEMRVLLLNTKNQVLGIEKLYSGSVNSALVRPAEVFAAAVKRTCPSVVIVHNHPSGDPAPSQEDVGMTERLVRAGQVLDVEVLDHIVIGQQGFVSMKEKGMGF